MLQQYTYTSLSSNSHSGDRLQNAGRTQPCVQREATSLTLCRIVWLLLSVSLFGNIVLCLLLLRSDCQSVGLLEDPHRLVPFGKDYTTQIRIVSSSS